MSFEYDAETDALYVYLRREGAVAKTYPLDDSRLVDVDEKGQPVGVELLGVSRGIRLDGLPEPEALGRLLSERRFPVHAVRSPDPQTA